MGAQGPVCIQLLPALCHHDSATTGRQRAGVHVEQGGRDPRGYMGNDALRNIPVPLGKSLRRDVPEVITRFFTDDLPQEGHKKLVAECVLLVLKRGPTVD